MILEDAHSYGVSFRLDTEDIPDARSATDPNRHATRRASVVLLSSVLHRHVHLHLVRVMTANVVQGVYSESYQTW